MFSLAPIVDRPALAAVANTLADTPETVITLHTLRRGLCRAYIVGDRSAPTALVIDSDSAPGEPSCYGNDAPAIWSVLRELPRWFAANMTEEFAADISVRIEQEWGERVTLLGDPHFILTRAITRRPHRDVRLLTRNDLALLEAAPADVRGAGFGSIATLLSDGIVAAAIVDGAIVATAHTSAITDRHADIGVATLPDYRRRGYATAAATLVAAAIQASGRTPVWSCGETNEASLATAHRLGFEPILRRVYVIIESRRR